MDVGSIVSLPPSLPPSLSLLSLLSLLPLFSSFPPPPLGGGEARMLGGKLPPVPPPPLDETLEVCAIYIQHVKIQKLLVHNMFNAQITSL